MSRSCSQSTFNAFKNTDPLFTRTRRCLCASFRRCISGRLEGFVRKDTYSGSSKSCCSLWLNSVSAIVRNSTRRSSLATPHKCILGSSTIDSVRGLYLTEARDSAQHIDACCCDSVRLMVQGLLITTESPHPICSELYYSPQPIDTWAGRHGQYSGDHCSTTIEELRMRKRVGSTLNTPHTTSLCRCFGFFGRGHGRFSFPK